MKNHPFESKAIFIWQVPSIAHGDPKAIADLLQGAGFQSVYIKAADGPMAFPYNLTSTLVNELHARGIAVVGWGFCYGNNPQGEAQIAIKQVQTFGLDGYIFDVESNYETPDAAIHAKTMLTAFKAACSVPTAFCSWAYWFSPTGSEWHPISMATAFMQFCDYAMPMIYWQGSTGAVEQLSKSLTQWKSFTDKPIIPVGRAYNGDGGTCTADQMTAFETQAHKSCKGVSWWGMDWAYKISDWWAALKSMPQFGSQSARNNVHVTFDTGETFEGTLDDFCAKYCKAAPAEPPSDPSTEPEPPTPPTPESDTRVVEMQSLFNGDAIYKKVKKQISGEYAREVTYHVIDLDISKFDIWIDQGVAVASTTHFLAANKLQIAINGLDGFITTRKGKSYITEITGFAASKGWTFGKLGNEQTLFISPDKKFSLDKPARIWDACGFPNLLVFDGQKQPNDKSSSDIRARTALGVNKAQTRVYLLCADGQDYYSKVGMTFDETTQVMLDLGCDLAVMADGGGSTTMVIEGADGQPKIMNAPSGENADGQRSVAIHFGFRWLGKA